MFIPLKFVKCIKMKKREGKKIKEHNGTYILMLVTYVKHTLKYFEIRVNICKPRSFR